MFIYQVNLYVLDLSYNRIKILGKGVFHGLQQLKSLNLIGNNVLHKLEAGAFAQLYSLTSLSLLNTKIEILGADTFNGMDYLQNLTISTGLLNVVEDGTFKSLVNLRRLDLRKQNIQDFSGDIFLGLSNLKGLYTDSFILCCLKPESVTECLPEAGEFSSCDDLMRREELRVFMWILGLMALLGNFCVILYRLIFDREGFRRGYGLFVTNLGISDFLMGIYMIIIAGADIMFRGRYIWNDNWWRNSPYCQFAGALATMSSEASALFLCAITLDRYLIIKYPFGQCRMNRLTTIIFSCCIWLFSIIVAMVPILPGTGFTGELYSRTGICLALPLTRERTPGWQFSAGIFIFFNFLTFALICLGQLLMYRAIVKSSSIVQNKGRRSRDVQVAKNLSLIVLTDFICWFPVCCLGLMTLSGTVINSEVYAWTAVFILPVNSALNPFLYTVTSFIGNKKIKKAAIQEAKATYSTENASSVMIRKLKSLWDNPDLYFGSAALGDQVITLKALLSSSELSASDILAIVEVVVRGLVAVHSQQLYFGNITEEDILIVLNNKKILKTQLSAKLVLPDQESSKQPDDVYGVGKLLGRLLRRYATTRRA
ncbi:G-protein coupled receptor GRL101-like [Patella vulgata]|uniref:G-protein coupled receptor GRL101-like n=1 Tax=Patella vulgata TaxID=6465 RepID=UPI0024A96ECA|nr:G-protein coupled receptor GRL101-like [Patella vulgata]